MTQGDCAGSGWTSIFAHMRYGEGRSERVVRQMFSTVPAVILNGQIPAAKIHHFSATAGRGPRSIVFSKISRQTLLLSHDSKQANLKAYRSERAS